MCPQKLGRGPAPRARRTARPRIGALLLLAGLLTGLLAGGAAAQPADAGSVVDVVEVDGVLDATVAAHLAEVIATANDQGSALIAVSLDAPGGVDVAADALLRPVLDSAVPVLVYVGDAGARASGAGALLAQSAHVLAMSPVTQLGVTHPVDLGAPGDRDALADRVGDLAADRGRDADAARATVTEDRVYAVLADGASAADVEPGDVLPGGRLTALTPAEAVDAGIVDVVEPSLGAALDAVSGRTVAVAGGREVTLDVDGATAEIRFNNLGLLDQVLTTVADPTIAYLLVVAGALAIVFELFQPGFGVAGVSGAGMAALGVYGLSVLPVRWAAFALLLAGLAVLTADLALAGLGVATALGALAVTAGSFLLFRGPDLLAPSPWVLGLLSAFTVLFFVVIMTTVLRAQGNQATAGAEHLVGRQAVVRSMLNPEGHVFVEGALWRARAPETAGRVGTGTVVRIVGLDDQLTLDVELQDADREAPVG